MMISSMENTELMNRKSLRAQKHCRIKMPKRLKHNRAESSKDVSVAAAVGVNVISHETLAYTGSGLVTVGGDIAIHATNNSNFKTIGSGAAVTDGSSIAVGVAISNISNDTKAYIGSTKGNRPDKTYHIEVKAISTVNGSDDYKNEPTTVAIAGAASGTNGNIGAAGALAIIVSNINTQAFVAPNSQILNGGDISIIAQENNRLVADAFAAEVTVNQQSKLGVGAAFAIIYSNNRVNAYIGSNSDVEGIPHHRCFLRFIDKKHIGRRWIF